MLTPYGIMLGGRHPKANIELHDLVFVLAENKEDAFAKAREKWFGDPNKVHGDAYINLSSVKGYRFSTEPNDHEVKLYAVNIGGYLNNEFGELHQYHFIVAPSKGEAKKAAKKSSNENFILPHMDDNLDVDDLIEVKDIEGKQLYWIEDPSASLGESESGYFPYKK